MNLTGFSLTLSDII